MKEATGDMTMTIVVIVGVVAVLALARPIWNIISNRITNEVTNNIAIVSNIEVIEEYNI